MSLLFSANTHLSRSAFPEFTLKKYSLETGGSVTATFGMSFAGALLFGMGRVLVILILKMSSLVFDAIIEATWRRGIFSSTVFLCRSHKGLKISLWGILLQVYHTSLSIH